jgi:hypothetical protein
MLKRITYVSRYAKPFTEAELDELAATAARNNRELDITGVLMTSGGIFFQTLEGPPEAVDSIYRAIVEDDRHTDVVLLGVEDNAAGRHYPNWSMKTINLDAASHVRLLPLKVMMETVYQQQQLVDKLLWTIDRTLRQEFRDG